MHARKIPKLIQWLKLVLLFPVMLLMGVEGGDPAGGDPGTGGDNTNVDSGTVLGGDPAAGGDGTKTAEEIAAAEAQAAADKAEADKAEADRVAALTPEEKAAEEAAAAKKAEEDAKAKAGAPEEYAEFTMPEGMQVDTALLDQFKPIAKELNLTQEQAQKLVDLQAQSVVNAEKTRAEQWANITKEWQTTAKADAEIGGTEYDANCKIAVRAINTFGTPELKTMLNQYGIGNHPEMIRLMTRIGKGMAEDKIVIPGAGVGTKKSIEDNLYGGGKA